MSLFSFLKSDKPAYSDKVWRTTNMALRGMITDAMLAITRKQTPVVICFFDDEFAQITQFLSEKGVPAISLQNYRAEKQEGIVWYASAHSAPEFMAALSKQPVAILFFGHYPLPAFLWPLSATSKGEWSSSENQEQYPFSIGSFLFFVR